MRRGTHIMVCSMYWLATTAWSQVSYLTQNTISEQKTSLGKLKVFFFTTHIVIEKVAGDMTRDFDWCWLGMPEPARLGTPLNKGHQKKKKKKKKKKIYLGVP